jgi:hypothetical protein
MNRLALGGIVLEKTFTFDFERALGEHVSLFVLDFHANLGWAF